MQQLYRFSDAAGQLLYIGISINAAARAAQHKHDKNWWPDVATMTIETHDVDRQAIEAIERDAIKRERPRYNVTHNVAPVAAPKPTRTTTTGQRRRKGTGGLRFDSQRQRWEGTVVVDLHGARRRCKVTGPTRQSVQDRLTQLKLEESEQFASDLTPENIAHMVISTRLRNSASKTDMCQACCQSVDGSLLERTTTHGRFRYYCCGTRWETWWSNDTYSWRRPEPFTPNSLTPTKENT